LRVTSRGLGDVYKRQTKDVADAAKATKETEKDIKRAIEMVAEKLHNSYSICKKSYIDPKIIEEVLHKN
jgi:DNA topoisomerase IB